MQRYVTKKRFVALHDDSQADWQKAICGAKVPGQSALWHFLCMCRTNETAFIAQRTATEKHFLKA